MDRVIETALLTTPAPGQGGDVPAAPPALVSRFSIVILACLLLGLGCGRALSPQTSFWCVGVGMAGVVMYIGLELTARRLRASQTFQLRESAETRLSQMTHPRPAVSRDAVPAHIGCPAAYETAGV